MIIGFIGAKKVKMKLCWIPLAGFCEIVASLCEVGLFVRVSVALRSLDPSICKNQCMCV